MFSLGWISKYRNELFGLSILSVIVFHYCEDVMQAFDKGILSISGNLGTMLAADYYKYVGSIGVELFIFLSGMGLYYSFHKNNNIKKFYEKRYKRILIPYAIVAVIFWGIKDFVIAGTSIWKFLGDISFYTFFSQGVKSIWFICLLIMLYFLFPHIYRVIYERKTPFYGFAVLMILTGCFPFIIRMFSQELYRNTEIAFTRVPLFVLGCYVGSFIKKGTEVRTRTAIIFVCATVAIGVVGSYLHFPSYISRYLDGIYSLGILVGLTYVMYLCDSWKGLRNVLTKMGAYSLELYMIHTVLRNLCKAYGVETYRVVPYVVMIGVSAILSIGLHKICEVINKKISEMKR